MFNNIFSEMKGKEVIYWGGNTKSYATEKPMLQNFTKLHEHVYETIYYNNM